MALKPDPRQANKLSLSVARTQTANNDASADSRFEMVSEESGSGAPQPQKSDITGGLDLDGVELK